MGDIRLPLDITDDYWLREGKRNPSDFLGGDDRKTEGKRRAEEWHFKKAEAFLFNAIDVVTPEMRLEGELPNGSPISEFPALRARAKAWWENDENHWISDIDDGKWMLYYDESVFNEKWVEIVNLYRNDKLTGVTSMKCSTGRKNPRAMGDDGVVILYCNYSFDEGYIKDIGRNLQVVTYYDKWMYYKTTDQTMNGTKATGRKVNHRYCLPPEIAPQYMLSSSEED